MITTIQIRDRVKEKLQSLKRENQTFEDVILILLKNREMYKQKNIELIKTEADQLSKINQDISKGLESVEEIGGEIVEW